MSQTRIWMWHPVRTPRRARWRAESQAYEYVWRYRSGKINVADPISRAPQCSAQMCDALALHHASLALRAGRSRKKKKAYNFLGQPPTCCRGAHKRKHSHNRSQSRIAKSNNIWCAAYLTRSRTGAQSAPVKEAVSRHASLRPTKGTILSLCSLTGFPIWYIL
jgi:hypothetical protein